MNPIVVNNMLSALPEGVAIEDNRQRVTGLIAMATSLLMPIPTQPLDGNYREYFYTNFDNIRNVMFEMNEAIAFDIDRSIDYAYAMWKARYNLVYFPKVSDFFRTDNPIGLVLNETMPEFKQSAGDADTVREVRELIRSELAG